jgi:hypothetical protein
MRWRPSRAVIVPLDDVLPWIRLRFAAGDMRQAASLAAGGVSPDLERALETALS